MTRRRRTSARAAVVLGLMGLMGCGGPGGGAGGGAGPAADEAPKAEGTITVDGVSHDLLRVHASTDAAADEYVRGKKLVLSAFVDDPDIAVFFDFDDVAAGTGPAVPFGAPDVTVLFDRHDYRALDATIEVVEGSLDEGAPVHVRVAATHFLSGCGDDDKEVAIDVTAPVDRLLPPPDASTPPAAGSIVGTFDVEGDAPVRTVALVDGTLQELASGPGWMMSSADRCETGALHWQFGFAVPASVAAGAEVSLGDGAPIAVRLDQVDVTTRVIQRGFVALAGTVHVDDPITNDPHGHARMELDGVRLQEADADGNPIDGGATVTLDHATLNAAIGAGLILP